VPDEHRRQARGLGSTCAGNRPVNTDFEADAAIHVPDDLNEAVVALRRVGDRGPYPIRLVNWFMSK
jgi:hypothetical protein